MDFQKWETLTPGVDTPILEHGRDVQYSRFKIQEGFYLTNNCYTKVVICQY